MDRLLRDLSDLNFDETWVFLSTSLFFLTTGHVLTSVIDTDTWYGLQGSISLHHDNLLHRLQSVLNAGVRLVFSARKFDHTTPLLCELHWLKVPERVKFRLCVLTYRCLTGTAPHYLAETIRPVSSRGTCQHLCSAETSTLLVPSARRSTLGDRSFSVAAARAWIALPQHVRNASSLPVFRRELKTVLFRSSFPDAI